MNKVNPFLYQNIDNSNHWIISEIILNQCKQHPNKKIIQFVGGPEWSFDDLKNNLGNIGENKLLLLLKKQKY